MKTKISKKLDKKFDIWLEEKISTLVFDRKNPFSDDEIKSWSKETAEWIIYIITPQDKDEDEINKVTYETINRIKDLHGII